MTARHYWIFAGTVMTMGATVVHGWGGTLFAIGLWVALLEMAHPTKGDL